jgi:hypothetical protein
MKSKEAVLGWAPMSALGGKPTLGWYETAFMGEGGLQKDQGSPHSERLSVLEGLALPPLAASCRSRSRVSALARLALPLSVRFTRPCPSLRSSPSSRAGSFT